jgi:hypothetical protein
LHHHGVSEAQSLEISLEDPDGKTQFSFPRGQGDHPLATFYATSIDSFTLTGSVQLSFLFLSSPAVPEELFQSFLICMMK